MGRGKQRRGVAARDGAGLTETGAGPAGQVSKQDVDQAGLGSNQLYFITNR